MFKKLKFKAPAKNAKTDMAEKDFKAWVKAASLTMTKALSADASADSKSLFFLDTAQEYADGEGFFMIFGKLGNWKQYGKLNKKKKGALYGLSEGSIVDGKLQLKLTVSGNNGLNDAKLEKALKSVGAHKFISLTLKEDANLSLDQAEAEDENEANLVDDSSVEMTDEELAGGTMSTLANEMQDEIADATKEAQEAAATGDAKKAASANAKFKEMADDITKLEGLLEKMAASDNAAEVQTLDKEIRTIFAKYQSKK